jgi:hypothetical protein
MNNSSVISSVDVTGVTKVGGSQYTESEGHPFSRSKEKGISDLGGEFFTSKQYVECGPRHNWRNSVPITNTPYVDYYNYDGICCAIDPSVSRYGNSIYHSDRYSNDNTLDALGATAISVVAPTNPVGSLLSALTELRNEGLPHLPGAQNSWATRASSARSAGDEYLNAQFGYVPLVNEILDFSKVATNAPAVIEQYRRGIGKPIRREYHFPTISKSSSDVLIGYNQQPHMQNANYYYGTGSLYRVDSMLRKRWFSGCFTYYFPSEILGSKKLGDIAILAHQLGLEPSPEVLWQVTPWSWAIDWFSNIGDVINNWSQFHEHGLVMRYGYMMEHTIIRSTYTLYNAQPITGSAPPISDVSYVVETKVRRKANPYGFGVSFDGLDAFKGSILAALGITRAR